jgi:hypothetical protein
MILKLPLQGTPTPSPTSRYFMMGITGLLGNLRILQPANPRSDQAKFPCIVPLERMKGADLA